MVIPSFLKKKIFWFLLAFLLLVVFLLYVFLPWVGAVPIKDSTKIYDRNGLLLYEIHSPRTTSREAVNIQKMPSFLLQAAVASEDKNFYSHHGADPEAILRAVMQNVSAGEIESGASTITSQVVKDEFYPDSSRSFLQKFREMTGAIAYDFTHSKESILENYLNRVYFGNKSYGIAAASETYFGKSPNMLSLSESAYLIGLIPSPESYNPYRFPDTAKKRQKEVLTRMVRLSYISQSDADEAYLIPIPLKKLAITLEAPHFVEYVIAELKKIYPDLENGGYEITTTLDLSWQHDGEAVVNKQITSLHDKHLTNGGLVVIEPSSGKIRVMVGSKDYNASDIDGKYNVTLAQRQPGSSLKPFTYLTAFMKDINPTDVAYDIETDFTTAEGKKYTPKNYDLRYHGPVSYATALGSSLNIIAVKVLDHIGFGAFYDTLARFGIHFEKDPEYYGLGITLGGGEVRLLDLTHAYSMLANGGEKTDLHYIESIRKNGQIVSGTASGTGTTLFPEHPLLGQQGIYLVNTVLRDEKSRSLSFGITNKLTINENVAVKTGTTKDFRDNWAVGYTPRIAVGVWVGNNDNSSMEGVSGVTGAIPIWNDFMIRRKNEITNIREEEWKRPAGIIEKEVCTFSGKLATSLCPEKHTGFFIEGKEPKEEDTWYHKVSIDLTTGKLAKTGCPGEVTEKTMLTLPEELIPWAQSIHLTLVPESYCDGTELTIEESSPTILLPKEGDIFYIDTKKPLAGQQIPLKIGGKGLVKIPILLDNEVIAKDFSAPFTQFLKPFPGTHVIKMGSNQVTFTIKEN